MQKLIKLNGDTPEIIDNGWTVVESEENGGDAKSVTESENAIFPVAVWETDHEALSKRSGATGIALENISEPHQLPGSLDSVDLITIPFPAFTDGRGFSLARILRQELNYKGEIRAVGDVLHDQLFFMYRCGFDAFQLREGVDIEHALNAFKPFTVKYQASVEEPLPLFSRV